MTPAQALDYVLHPESNAVSGVAARELVAALRVLRDDSTLPPNVHKVAGRTLRDMYRLCECSSHNWASFAPAELER